MLKIPKSTAFKPLKSSNSYLKKFLEEKSQVNDDDLLFDDFNFGIEKKLHFNIRNNNPINIITTRIIDSLRTTIPNYNYFDPSIRRELTSPHEGNVK